MSVSVTSLTYIISPNMYSLSFIYFKHFWVWAERHIYIYIYIYHLFCHLRQICTTISTFQWFVSCELKDIYIYIYIYISFVLSFKTNLYHYIDIPVIFKSNAGCLSLVLHYYTFYPIWDWHFMFIIFITFNLPFLEFFWTFKSYVWVFQCFDGICFAST